MLAAVAALVLGTRAGAQGFGQQPGFSPAPFQQPGPFQTLPPAPGDQGGGGPTLVGTWSGQSNGPSGPLQQADSFSPDGRFVTAGRLPNGFLLRAWGNYRVTRVGPNQLRLETELQGWLPRELCRQMAGEQPQCQPFQLPSVDVSLVTFSSPDQLQSTSLTSPGGQLNEARDNQPFLLQTQAPERWTSIVQPSPNVSPVPFAGVPRPNVTPAPAPLRNACPNDDIQTNICKYSGSLVRSGGCLRCVGG